MSNTDPEHVAALHALIRELEFLTEGEGCDHSVNVCWCATFDALEKGRAALAKLRGEYAPHPTEGPRSDGA